MEDKCKNTDFRAELVVPVLSINVIKHGEWPLYMGRYTYMRCDNCDEEFTSEKEAIAHYETSN